MQRGAMPFCDRCDDCQAKTKTTQSAGARIREAFKGLDGAFQVLGQNILASTPSKGVNLGINPRPSQVIGTISFWIDSTVVKIFLP